MSLTYAGTGVNYDAMDPFKRACQMRAALTSGNAMRFGLASLDWTRAHFTMDPELSYAVREVFIKLYEEGLEKAQAAC